jgi:hypothetical protein
MAGERSQAEEGHEGEGGQVGVGSFAEGARSLTASGGGRSRESDELDVPMA